MKTYYVTFGQYHPLKDGWVEIQAETYDEARLATEKLFGLRFGSVYWAVPNSNYYRLGKLGKTVLASEIIDHV